MGVRKRVLCIHINNFGDIQTLAMYRSEMGTRWLHYFQELSIDQGFSQSSLFGQYEALLPYPFRNRCGLIFYIRIVSSKGDEQLLISTNKSNSV